MRDLTLPAAAVPASFVENDGAFFWLEKTANGKQLVIEGASVAVLDRFEGKSDQGRFRADANAANALALRNTLTNLRPARFGLKTSVGMGDRLGISTPAHVAALKAVGGSINPIFAQQSVREVARTNRTPRIVLDDATWGAFEGGWIGPVSADADHLHTVEDIDAYAQAGFVFWTIDPGDKVDPEAQFATAATLRAKAEALDWKALDSSFEAFLAAYRDHAIELENESIVLDEESLVRAIAKYGPALVKAVAMAGYLQSLGIEHEIEIAIDETEFPTTPAEHVVVISELARLGVKPVSFSPRFVGGFEKGIEYIGDVEELTRDFQVHAAIAKALGPYKLSLHSASDKYCVYEPFVEATGGVLHMKTSGTTWAEALRVIVNHDPQLMRELLDKSLQFYDQNRQSYPMTADPSTVPAHPTPGQLERLLDVNASRQILHVGFGTSLATFHDRLFDIWNANTDELREILTKHFIRHLQPFAN
ncbi:MAG: tagaturonate epimerase family protein [Propionibacteriaceae bacterium]|jgi:hypothetical protein|nr:tagaturonate epimerase family protein [Propionibacteriaceae bacterium]